MVETQLTSEYSVGKWGSKPRSRCMHGWTVIRRSMRDWGVGGFWLN